MANNPFYQYYDSLFQAKDYQAETNLIFELTERFGIKSPKKILEIGCGTGNHTKVLTEKGVNLVAIDNDEEMVKLAKDKLKENDKLKIVYTNIEDLKEDNFDLSLAMFNVVTYIPTTAQLDSFIEAVYQRLNAGGIFVFDCWNGIAAIKDPPKIKQTEIIVKAKKIKVTVTPQTNFFDQKTTLTYEIENETYSLDQTLWTPMQISDAIKKAGLGQILCSPILQPDKKATEKDWKIMFVAKKN